MSTSAPRTRPQSLAARIGLLAVTILLALAPARHISAQAAPTPTPVLIELFTSEGCSSCPPADALLAKLDATQFVPGAHAIVLSEHVTYWNYLGWRDPFSMDQMSDRQSAYDERFGLQSVYTPQVIVDGAAEALGSDPAAVSRAITRAAKSPKPQLTLDSLAWEGDTLHFAAHAQGRPDGVLTAAIAQDATQSVVSHGENAGRTLHHVAVVRVMKEMGKDAADGRQLTLRYPENAEDRASRTPLRLVVFMTDRNTGKVLALAQVPTARP